MLGCTSKNDWPNKRCSNLIKYFKCRISHTAGGPLVVSMTDDHPIRHRHSQRSRQSDWNLRAPLRWRNSPKRCITQNKVSMSRFTKSPINYNFFCLNCPVITLTLTWKCTITSNMFRINNLVLNFKLIYFWQMPTICSSFHILQVTSLARDQNKKAVWYNYRKIS